MQDRFAFTAAYWGEAAVVCRADEDRPGPIVDRKFGQFATWTQAHSFATRLNEGLNIPPVEARQIVTSSILCTNELFRTVEIPERAGDSPAAKCTAGR